LTTRSGSQAAAPAFLSMQADVFMACGMHEHAGRVLDLASASSSTGQHFWDPEILRQKAELALQFPPEAGGNAAADTEEQLRLAVATAESTGARSLQLRAATSLARLDASRGQPGEGRTALAAVLRWFTEGHGRPDLVDAQGVLAQLR